jgi:hypothetical protein
MKARQKVLLFAVIHVWFAFGVAAVVRGDIVFLDDFAEDSNSARFVIEAEHYSSRSSSTDAGWWEVDGGSHKFIEGPTDGEDAPTAQNLQAGSSDDTSLTTPDLGQIDREQIDIRSSLASSTSRVVRRPRIDADQSTVKVPGVKREARGNYMVIMGTVSSSIAPSNSSYDGAFMDYRVAIEKPGTYRLYARWLGLDLNSDSFYALLLKPDGTVPKGTGPDYFIFHQFRRSWYWANRGIGGTPYSGTAGSPDTAVWRIKEPGDYTIRVAQRENRTALDTLVFQTEDLSSPAN